MSSLAQRGQVITLLSEAIGMGARQDRACAAICLSERTLQRWQRDAARGDHRSQRLQAPKNKLSVLERERLVAIANSDEFGLSLSYFFAVLRPIMARPLRLELALYHVTSRGDGREDICLSGDYRVTCRETFAEVCRRISQVCHAYSQMTHYDHVVVEAPTNLSKGMRRLNGVYMQRFGRAFASAWGRCFRRDAR